MKDGASMPRGVPWRMMGPDVPCYFARVASVPLLCALCCSIPVSFLDLRNQRLVRWRSSSSLMSLTTMFRVAFITQRTTASLRTTLAAASPPAPILSYTKSVHVYSFSNTATTATDNPQIHQLPSLKTTKKILKEHCKKRKLQLTTYSRGTAWSMALQISRYDSATANGRTYEEDKNLVHGLKPSLEEEDAWKKLALSLDVNYNDDYVDQQKGWKKRIVAKQRKIKKRILHEKKMKYVDEAVQILRDRDLWWDAFLNKSVDNEYVNPDAVLLKFSRLMAADLRKKDKEESRKRQIVKEKEREQNGFDTNACERPRDNSFC